MVNIHLQENMDHEIMHPHFGEAMNTERKRKSFRN